MVVNKCSVATAIDSAYSLNSYADGISCDTESESRIDEIMVATKTLQQSLDPAYYDENGETRGTFGNR